MTRRGHCLQQYHHHGRHQSLVSQTLLRSIKKLGLGLGFGRKKMRKGKVNVKRIDDKTSRQICFCKRRTGLFKKAEELSVLCEADVAVFVFSNTNKRYEFPDDALRLNKILERYTALVKVKKDHTGTKVTENCSENSTTWKCNNVLEAVQRYMQEGNVDQMDTNDIVQLEHILDSTLQLALKRKTHLMTDTFQGSNREVGDMVSSSAAAAAAAAEVEDENGKKKKNNDDNSSSGQGCSLLREAMLRLA